MSARTHYRNRRTWRPAWVAGALPTGRRPRSAGSPSSSSPSGSAAWSGRRTSTRTPPGPGESGRMDRILDAGFKQPAAESVLDPEPHGSRGHACLRRRGRGRRRAASPKIADVQNIRSPLDPATPTRSRRTGTRRSSSSRSAATKDKAVDKIAPVLAGVAAAQHAHPGFTIGEFGDASASEGGRDGVRERPRQGGAALAADHADRPRARLRRARCGGDPAAARPDRRLRDVRPHRAAEPPAAGRDGGARDGAPDRARGRRRLLDVLLEARTAGASRRAERAGGARSRRRDLRPLRADLGADGDRRDGRHVPDRRHDLLVARASRRSSSSRSPCSAR